MDRDCDKCVYHTSGSCSKWECDFTTISDIRHEMIDDMAELCDLYKKDASCKCFGERECEIDKIIERMRTREMVKISHQKRRG